MWPISNKRREYQAPSASIGAPEGYQFEPVTIPQYGAGDGGNSNGGGGWGGWGGGGDGGDPMKGFTYLFAALVFGMLAKRQCCFWFSCSAFAFSKFFSLVFLFFLQY